MSSIAIVALTLEGAILLLVAIPHLLAGSWLGVILPAGLAVLSLGAAWALKWRRDAWLP